MWSGWQGDLIDQGTNVVAYLPFAMQDGKPLRGTVRQEFSPMEQGVLSHRHQRRRRGRRQRRSPTRCSTARPPR